MRELCHRCHAELPALAAGSSRHDEDAPLFCPRCGAPQIFLPEHMRSDPQATPTTGNAAPSPAAGFRNGPGEIDWHAAISAILIVAGIAMALTALGSRWPSAASMGVFWTVSGSAVALGLYARKRPTAWIDGRVGLRIGLAAGLIISAAIGATLATSGVVLRFATHRMDRSDQENLVQRKAMQAQVLNWMTQNNADKELQAKYAAQLASPQLNSPEMLAAGALVWGGFVGTLVLVFSAAGGAFAGMLRGAQARRTRIQQG